MLINRSWDCNNKYIAIEGAIGVGKTTLAQNISNTMKCQTLFEDYADNPCSFCSGHGKVGMTPCKTCNAEKRILGKQKLSGIKLEGDESKIESMGHHSKNEPGKSGYLLILKC